ncbi:tetratricopeptide repeat protein [Leptolyngbya sp. FACHB-261]|uniref:tetratricopeptide repeat protein n=1 Tax=Leptolyngbya sp. FACHB-261 TaxID=2692806 RepID=UPI00168265A8|nr:tetratricopeptide repeat protein [Leptolyngbya sp. FACHB-261]MBD2104315.1 tetratricopeptide repeat protein [Leptolyngbya sp. FACHB-261]
MKHTSHAASEPSKSSSRLRLALAGLLLLALINPLLTAMPAEAQSRLQQGNVYLQRGQANEAIREFQAVLRNSPNQVQAQLGLAQAYSKLTRWAQAIAAYERVLQLDSRNETALRALGELGGYESNPNWRRTGINALGTLLELKPQDSAARLRRAQLLSWSGQLTEALADYQVLLRSGRVSPAACVAAAQAYTWAGQYTQAVSLFRQAQQAGATLAEAESLDYARALAQSGDTDQAVALTRTVLRQAPRDSNLNANLVLRVADILGDIDSERATALQFYQQVARSRPNDRPLALNILRLQTQLGQLSAAQAQSQLLALVQPLPAETAQREALAVSLLRFPATASLIPVYQQFLQAGVDQPFLQFRLAQAYLDQNNFEAARSALSAYLAVRPGDDGAQLVRAEIERRAGNLALARQIYEQALNQQPEAVDALVGLAAVASDEGNEPEALKLYQQLIRLRPDDLNLKARWAQLAYGQNAISEAEALAVLNQWFAAYPNTEVVPPALINLVAALPPKPERLDLYQRLLRLDPDQAGLRLRLAQVYLASGNLTEAETEVARVLEQQPQNVGAYFVRAEIAQAQRRPEQAIQVYHQILSFSPNNIDALRSWAGVEFQQQRYVAATSLYQRVLSVQPKDRAAQLALADLAAIAGRRLEALNRLDQVQQASPADPNAESAELSQRRRQVREDLLLQRGFAPYWERY